MVKRKGFTLIEIIVVVGVLIIIMTVGVTSFLNVLRSSTKSNTATLVKQNGDHALSIMSRMIRNARELVTYDEVEGKELTIKNPDGQQTTFSCRDEELDIASNGASLIESGVKIVDCSYVFDIQRSDTGLKPDVVIIVFTLEQTGDGLRSEEQVSIGFKTTVVLRNIRD